MESVKEQRICVIFCFRVVKTVAQTHNMLHETYSDDALSQTMTYEGFTHFKNGRISTDENEWSGQFQLQDLNL
jgi:hypothetical protein